MRTALRMRVATQKARRRMRTCVAPRKWVHSRRRLQQAEAGPRRLVRGGVATVRGRVLRASRAKRRSSMAPQVRQLCSG